MPASKPPLSSSLRDLLEEERRVLGDHPDLEEWLALRAGRVEDERAESLRDHLAVCQECADLFLDLAAFTGAEPPEGTPPVSDAEVKAALWQIQTRLGQEPTGLQGAAPAKPMLVEPLPLAEKNLAEVRHLKRDAPRRPFWRSALAAGLAAAVAGLLLWNVSSRFRGWSDSPQPRVYASAVRQGSILDTTRPPREGVRSGPSDGGAEKRLEAGKDQRLTVELPAGARRYSTVRLSIVGLPGGKTEFRSDQRLAVPREKLILEIPAGSLSAGRYRVLIEGLEEGGTKELAFAALRLVD